MAETAAVEQYEPGVFEAPHRSLNRQLWLYASDTEGCIIAWLEYGGKTNRTREEATARLWEILDATTHASSSRGAAPGLRLIS